MQSNSNNTFPINPGNYVSWWCHLCQATHYGPNPHGNNLVWQTTQPVVKTSGTSQTFSNVPKSPGYKTFDEAIAEVAAELAAMVIEKQTDYGPTNILDAPGGPENGILIRLWDKVSRLKNLTLTKADPKNESIEDTYRDIAGYALVALMVKKGYFELPLAKVEEKEG